MGRWIASGGYEWIAERAFRGLEADALFLEYDSERAGGFEPLRFVPKDKRVVLGLVSTKTPVLEGRDFLRSISPQCGFASHQKGTGLTFAEQEAKLRLVIGTAHAVWGSA
jgi:5-methyltetrahydropteroyltriglutamate--homocysteine methyltransferase